ncbi:MAG TPA: carbohydrate ABC transporter permease [Chloroflexia bacterium]|nr:carbohydrate ABC transporter permease [Chloroflexia bacterium]
MATMTTDQAAVREGGREAEDSRVAVRRPGNRTLRLVGIYVVLVLVALIILLPLLWLLSTSLKLPRDLFTNTIDWIPRTVTFDNYTRLFANQQTPVGRWFLNSLAIASITTLLVLTVDSMAAYAYARMNFPGRNALFGIMLLTLFLPGFMFIIPNFLTVNFLGLINNWGAVILPGLAGVFGVFFLRQFFQGIPKELEEAAEIDGANRFEIFYRIVLPLSRPALATLGIITFLASWNDFLWPLLVLKDRQIQTLPPGLSTLQSAYTSDYGLIMAGAVVVAIPVLVLYMLLQRYIVQSVASTGLKG